MWIKYNTLIILSFCFLFFSCSKKVSLLTIPGQDNINPKNESLKLRDCQSQPNNSAGGVEVSLNNGNTWSACTGFSCNAGYAFSNNQQYCLPVGDFLIYGIKNKLNENIDLIGYDTLMSKEYNFINITNTNSIYYQFINFLPVKVDGDFFFVGEEKNISDNSTQSGKDIFSFSLKQEGVINITNNLCPSTASCLDSNTIINYSNDFLFFLKNDPDNLNLTLFNYNIKNGSTQQIDTKAGYSGYIGNNYSVLTIDNLVYLNKYNDLDIGKSNLNTWVFSGNVLSQMVDSDYFTEHNDHNFRFKKIKIDKSSQIIVKLEPVSGISNTRFRYWINSTINLLGNDNFDADLTNPNRICDIIKVSEENFSQERLFLLKCTDLDGLSTLSVKLYKANFNLPNNNPQFIFDYSAFFTSFQEDFDINEDSLLYYDNAFSRYYWYISFKGNYNGLGNNSYLLKIDESNNIITEIADARGYKWSSESYMIFYFNKIIYGQNGDSFSFYDAETETVNNSDPLNNGRTALNNNSIRTICGDIFYYNIFDTISNEEILMAYDGNSITEVKILNSNLEEFAYIQGSGSKKLISCAK